MSCTLRRGIGVALIGSALLTAGCGMLAQKSDEAEELEVETPNPTPSSSHEIFSASTAHSSHVLSVLYPPPAPLDEQPPEPKPSGDGVVWAPGYWTWDTMRDNWAWVGGVWVHAPAHRHWVSGYWGVVADGWRWVPGFWTVDDPPSPAYSSSPSVAYTPDAGYYNDPWEWYSGFGMWFPWGGYYRPWREGPQGSERPPLLPSGHAASIPIAVHGPEADKVLPSLMPALASSMHEAPETAKHLDMASILASVPKPMAAEFALHPELHATGGIGTPPFSLEHPDRIASLFSTAHMEAALHQHPGVHEAISSHPSEGHGGGSHESGGHGGK